MKKRLVFHFLQSLKSKLIFLTLFAWKKTFQRYSKHFQWLINKEINNIAIYTILPLSILHMAAYASQILSHTFTFHLFGFFLLVLSIFWSIWQLCLCITFLIKIQRKQSKKTHEETNSKVWTLLLCFPWETKVCIFPKYTYTGFILISTFEVVNRWTSDIYLSLILLWW